MSKPNILKLIHILTGVGATLLYSGIETSNTEVIYIAYFMLLVCFISEYFISKSLVSFVELISGGFFGAIFPNVFLKNGEFMVQALCMSWIFGGAFIAALYFDAYNEE